MYLEYSKWFIHQAQHTVDKYRADEAEDGTFHCRTDVLNETLLLKRKTRTDLYRNDPKPRIVWHQNVFASF